MNATHEGGRVMKIRSPGWSGGFVITTVVGDVHCHLIGMTVSVEGFVTRSWAV